MNLEERMKLYKVDDFPLSGKYDHEFVEINEMGPNVLWITESLMKIMKLKPNMRVLDLGCGTALSSIFLAKEFNVQVWATDLWVNPSENLKNIRKFNLEDKVFPIHADARELPYADDFFDAIVSFDSYHYFGTDVHYLEFYLLKLLKKGGQIGIISPASPNKIPNPAPKYLGDDWFWMNTVDWWKENFSRNPNLSVKYCDLLPNGWEYWVRWNEFVFSNENRNSHNTEKERQQLIQDKGKHLGFVRLLADKI